MASVQQVSDGLGKVLIQEGGGARPNAGDTITVECTGNLGDGSGQGNITKKFWRSVWVGLHGWSCGVGGVAWLVMVVWEGLHGWSWWWCGRGCMVGRVVWVGLHGWSCGVGGAAWLVVWCGWGCMVSYGGVGGAA